MSDDNSPVNETGRTEDGSSPGSRASSRAPPPLSKSDAEQCIVLAKVDITAHVSPPTFFKAKAIEIDSLAAEEDVRWVALTSVPKKRRGPYPKCRAGR